jgi:transposase
MKYPSDVTETQFKLISKHIPQVKSKRPRKYYRLDIFNAILYRVKTGCMWRYLPSNYPKWQLVYYYFCKWKMDKNYEAHSTPFYTVFFYWVDFFLARLTDHITSSNSPFNNRSSGVLVSQPDRTSLIFL